MKSDFDYLKWFIVISYTFDDYSVLYEYIQDDKAHDVHADRYKNSFENEHYDLGLKFVGMIKEYHKGISRSMIQNSLAAFSNQMLVMYSTYIENIIKEYFTSLFINHPERMLGYLRVKYKDDKELVGYISFKKVLASSSKESLMESLAIKSSTIVSKGEIKSVLKRLSELSNYAFSNEVVNGIEKLIKIRNKIVHEFHKEDLSIVNVKNYTKLILNFLEEVKKSAIQNELRVIDFENA